MSGDRKRAFASSKFSFRTSDTYRGSNLIRGQYSLRPVARRPRSGALKECVCGAMGRQCGVRRSSPKGQGPVRKCEGPVTRRRTLAPIAVHVARSHPRPVAPCVPILALRIHPVGKLDEQRVGGRRGEEIRVIAADGEAARLALALAPLL